MTKILIKEGKPVTEIRFACKRLLAIGHPEKAGLFWLAEGKKA